MAQLMPKIQQFWITNEFTITILRTYTRPSFWAQPYGNAACAAWPMHALLEPNSDVVHPLSPLRWAVIESRKSKRKIWEVRESNARRYDLDSLALPIQPRALFQPQGLEKTVFILEPRAGRGLSQISQNLRESAPLPWAECRLGKKRSASEISDLSSSSCIYYSNPLPESFKSVRGGLDLESEPLEGEKLKPCP